MADFFGWMTDVFELSFTIGATTVNLGYLAVAGVIVSIALKALKKIR